MANKHGDFICYELLTSDADAAKEFYPGIFGWTLKESGQQDMDYHITGATEGAIGGLMQRTDDMKPGGARPVGLGCFGVDNVDETEAAIVKADGVQIIVDPSEIPGGELSVNAVEPQGAMFAFVGPCK